MRRPAWQASAFVLAGALFGPALAAAPDPTALRRQERQIVRRLAALDLERAALRQRLRKTRSALAASAMPASPPATGSVPPPMRMPAAGRVIQRWGAPTRAGPAEGLILRTAAHAPVWAGCGGRVLFAGPFRSYGRLLILDCGGTARLVTGGLGRLVVAAGQAVKAGAPVGTMGDGRDLYLELRRNERTIDPLPALDGR